MSPYAPPAPERYTWQWMTFWGVSASLMAWAVLASRQPPVFLKEPHVAPGEGVTWFLVIRMPEAPADKSEAAAMQANLASWLEGFRRAGFHPMLLSSVTSRLDKGFTLPRKTLVLLFQPGYRHTYEIVAPILAQHRCPSVWVTNQTAIQRSDRRYLSRHALGQMQRSGLWDVAWYPEAQQDGLLTAELIQEGPGRATPPRHVSLDLRMTHQALNQALPGSPLSRLNIHPSWTAQEFVDRLLAEVPTDGVAHLTARHIGSRVLGVAIEADASAQRLPFRLEAPMDARVAYLAWPSTSGKNDLLLELNLLSRSGEVWVLLRSNPSIGQGVRVGFTEQAILVEQDHQGSRTRLTAVPWPASSQDRLVATIVLQDHHLHLLVDDEPVLAVDSIQAPTDPRGQVTLVLYDKIRGAAGANPASLVFVPLHETRRGSS